MKYTLFCILCKKSLKKTQSSNSNDFVTYKPYKEIDAFGWKIHERINSVIESMKKEKSSQNLSNKEKTSLRNLIKTKNDKIIINDTYKNMGGGGCGET